MAVMFATSRKNTMKNIQEKSRSLFIKRQQVLFLTILILGAIMSMMGAIYDERFLIEGVAFLIVGLVGLVMSWTTFDVATGLKDVVKDEGVMTRKAITDMAEKMDQNHKEVIQNHKETVQGIKELIHGNKEIVKGIQEIVQILKNKN